MMVTWQFPPGSMTQERKSQSESESVVNDDTCILMLHETHIW